MGWKGVALQFLGLPLAWVGMLYYQQDSLIYHPRHYKGGKRDLQVKNGLVGKWLDFATADGNQSALLLQPKKSKTSRVYFVFGGNAMLAKDWLDILVQSFGIAPNIAFVLVDYPGYGYSQGSPSQAAIRRSSLEVLELANSHLGVGREDLEFGALGHSIGCAAAFQLAAAVRNDPSRALKHLVLTAPFASLALEAQSAFPPLSVVPTWLIALLAARNAWDNLGAAEKLAGEGAPLVEIMHGFQDSIVPFHHGERLHKHLKALGVPVNFKGVMADHNDLLSLDVYWDWLKGALGQ